MGVESLYQLKNEVERFMRACGPDEALRAAIGVIDAYDGFIRWDPSRDVKRGAEELVQGCLKVAISKAETAPEAQKSQWHQVLGEFEDMPISDPTIRARLEMLKAQNVDQVAPLIDALQWIYGISGSQARVRSERLGPHKRREVLDTYHYRPIYEIEALARFKGIGFGQAQQALGRYAPRDQRSILSNPRVQEIARRLARSSTSDL